MKEVEGGGQGGRRRLKEEVSEKVAERERERGARGGKNIPISYLLHVPGVEPDPSYRRLRVHGRDLLPRGGAGRLWDERETDKREERGENRRMGMSTSDGQQSRDRERNEKKKSRAPAFRTIRRRASVDET